MGDKFYFTGDLERAVKDNDVIVANLVERRLEEYFNRDVEMALVANSTYQTISNNTTTVIAFNTDQYDPYEWHDTSSNNGRIYPTAAGFYEMTINTISGSGLADGTRAILSGYLNGTGGSLLFRIDMAQGSANAAAISCSRIFGMVVGDYVVATIYHNSGGDETWNTTASLKLIQHT